jgi:hypothetical protein
MPLTRIDSETHFGVILGFKLVSWYSEDSSTAFDSAIVCATVYRLPLLVGATFLRVRHAGRSLTDRRRGYFL